MAASGSAARRYAEAMLDIATQEQAVNDYRAQLDGLASALDERTIRMLRDPSLPLARRLAAASEATADVPGPIRALAAMLVERGRIGLIPEIAVAFDDLVDERAGVAKAKITTAVEVDRAHRDRMVEQLGRATGRTIRATFAVDAALLGGATVQVGDHLVDASLRTRLETLRRQLAT